MALRLQHNVPKSLTLSLDVNICMWLCGFCHMLCLYFHNRHSIDYMAKYGGMVLRLSQPNNSQNTREREKTKEYFIFKHKSNCVFSLVVWLVFLLLFPAPLCRTFRFNANHIFLSAHTRVLSDFCSICVCVCEILVHPNVVFSSFFSKQWISPSFCSISENDWITRAFAFILNFI